MRVPHRLEYRPKLAFVIGAVIFSVLATCPLFCVLVTEARASSPASPETSDDSMLGKPSTSPGVHSDLHQAFQEWEATFGIQGAMPAEGVRSYFSAELNAAVAEISYRGGESLVIDKATMQPLKFTHRHDEDVPSGLSRAEGLDSSSAEDAIDLVLKSVGAALRRDNEPVRYIDVADRGPADLFGAIYVFRRDYEHRGYKCHMMGLTLIVSAYSGAVRSFKHIPVQIPASMDRQIDLTEAMSNAEQALGERFPGSHISFTEKRDLALVLVDDPKLEDSRCQRRPTRLCWALSAIMKVASSEKEGRHVIVYVDANSGIVVTPLFQSGR